MEHRKLNIRLLSENDIDQVNDFHNRFHHDDRTYEMFRWEFYNAPAGKAIYIVAEDIETKRIVGTQSAIPILLKGANGITVLTAKSEDTLVDPDYRGMQIFEKMYDLLFKQCKDNGINYIWGFTAALKPFKKIGFELPFSHSQSLMVLRITSAYSYLSKLNPKNSTTDKIKILSLTIFSRLKSFFSCFGSFKENKARINGSIIVKENFNGLIDSVLKQYKGLYTFDESEEYIEWRITKNPYHDNIYSISFHEEGELTGSVVFNHHKGRVWYLVQALFEEKLSRSLKQKYLRAAFRNLIKTKSPVLIRSWNFNTNEVNSLEINLLQSIGCVHISRGVYFVWKDLQGEQGLIPENFILSRLASQGVI